MSSTPPLPRNRLEAAAAKALPGRFAYEAVKLPYQLPTATYTPDWYDEASHTIIETKGLWRDSDRRKMRLIRAQYPALRIIMVFSDPAKKISKRSRTTYRQYAEKLGIEVLSLDQLKSV